MNKKHFLIFFMALCLTGCGLIQDIVPQEEASVSTVSEDPIVIPVEPEEETAASGDGTGAVSLSENLPEEPPQEYFEGYPLSPEDVSENSVLRKSVSTPGQVSLIFAGDIDFDDRYANMNALRSRGGGIRACIGASLLTRMNEADLCMINNEFPYSRRGTPTAGKKFTFRARPETVDYLNVMGADIVSLANNHAYDYGPDALLDTFDILKGAGIPYVGAGHNLAEAMQPVYYIAGGMKIAFVSATQIERSLPPDTKEATETDPGVLRTLEPEKFLSVIREADEKSDFVVAYVHWGSEGTHEFEASQRDLARAYADAGADLIMGDHPHVLQGFDYMDDVPVLYSLGNYWFNSKTLDTCLVEAVLREGSLASLRFIPALQHNCRTDEVLPGDGNFGRILGEMRKYSTDRVSIDDEGFVSRAGGN